MLDINDLRVGTNIQLEGTPYTITWSQHSKQARGAGVMKVKLRNLLTGASLDRTFQGNEKLEEAMIQFRSAQFLYADGDQYEFMDQESYETVVLPADRLGTMVHFLVDGAAVDIQYFDDRPINVQIPTKLAFKVAETEPGVKGDTATSATKMAKLETGYELKVPLFINQGEMVVVNTLSGEYVERAK